MEIIKKILDDSVIYLGILLGTVLQYMVLGKDRKQKFRFALFLILSSIFTAFYVVSPILNYLHICDEEWAKAFYALSSAISLSVVSFIINVLPKTLQKKAISMIGIEDEDN